jgi:very-short-patch-repair endonuclease
MTFRGPRSGSKSTTKRRQYFRNNLTASEDIFWSRVSRKQLCNLKFRRQHGIGAFIVDFYCPEIKLVIEIDGTSHFIQRGIRETRPDQSLLSHWVTPLLDIQMRI